MKMMQRVVLLLAMSLARCDGSSWRSRRRGELEVSTTVIEILKFPTPKSLAVVFEVCQPEFSVTDPVTDMREFLRCLASTNKIVYKIQSINWSNILGGGINTLSAAGIPKQDDGKPKHNESNETSDEAVELACQLHVGSFARKPFASPCLMRNGTTEKHGDGGDSVLQKCDKNLALFAPFRGRCIARMTFYTVAWLFTNLNYALIVFCTIFVLPPATYLAVIKKNKAGYPLLFTATNVMWMAWRWQENLNWYSKWQASVPYVCVATNTLRYLMEGIMMFLFCSTSMERYLALAGSFALRIKRSKVSSPGIVLGLGAITGALCSLLNILVLFFMTSPNGFVLKTCSLREANGADEANGENLVPLVVAKVLSLLILYLVPCAVMSAANIAVSRSLVKKMKKSKRVLRSSRKRDAKKTKVISGFLVFCSLFMVCCGSKPMFEVYAAINLHVGGEANAEGDAVGLMMDVITWNLTTLAYVINTVVGLRYTQ